MSLRELPARPNLEHLKNQARTLRELALILDFNRRQPAGARFSGIKYDVEPQTLEEWRRGGAIRKMIMLDYLQCLASIHQTLATNDSSGGRMQLAVDIPFWWNKLELKI